MSILGFIGFLALDIWTYLHHGELKFPASVLAFITMIVSIVQIYYILTNIFYFVAEKEESAPASDREMIKT